MIAIRILLAAAGVVLVVHTVLSAIRTFVLPRGVPDRLTRYVFRATRLLFDKRVSRVADYTERDRIMALYSPLSLIALPIVWLTLVLIGYSAIFWGLGLHPIDAAIRASGSSLLTLGFAALHTLPQSLVGFTEAAIGLLLAALLVAYLPTMYAAWSRREAAVTQLEVRAGKPPRAWELLLRYNRLQRLNDIRDLWPQWESWFIDIEETHTSLSPLTFFRSAQPDRSWVTAAGTMLDLIALWASTVDVPRDPQAELSMRAGYMALRRICDFFGIQYDPDPEPTDPISIQREEYDEVYDLLARENIPVRIDRQAAWKDFAGWRVNYDAPLLRLAAFTMAPYAPWTSDRSVISRPEEPIVTVPVEAEGAEP